MNRIAVAVVALVALAALPVRAAEPQERVTFKASDGETVYGWSQISPQDIARKRAVILLFHQAGSSHAEYTPTQAILARHGWDSIAIDQRSGGTMYGPNETVKKRGKSAPSYEDALPDVLGAVDYSRAAQPRRHVILWGSSYSAALVFFAAQQRKPDVRAVLAFSPGEYLTDPHSVRPIAADIGVPLFVEETPSEKNDAQPLVAAAGKFAQNVVVAQGIHGSSTLRKDKNPKGYRDAWKPVLAFLETIKKR